MENPNRVTGVRRIDMLEVYHRRGSISTRGYNAAERLREAWLRTETGRGAKWCSDRVDGGVGYQAAVATQIDKISAFARLSAAVSPADRRIIDCVVYQGAGIGALPEYRGSRHADGVAQMGEAFDRLSDRMEAMGL